MFHFLSYFTYIHGLDWIRMREKVLGGVRLRNVYKIKWPVCRQVFKI